MREMGYGFFHGGDPREFTPDFESCTPQEITSWKEACDSWDRGEKVVCEGSHRWLVDVDGKVIGTATVSSFGIGTYWFDLEEDEAI